jgi:16S rRNA (guanine966-N2)-methyltransferase
MIRITSGTLKNKQLKTPEIEGYRAVQEKAKLALFSILGDRVVDATCLDLFAGSGNLGIEALSRGATWCDFVDSNKISKETIDVNVFDCGLLEKAQVSGKDVVKFVIKTEKTYDIIFLDPFYKETAYIFLVKNLEKILKKDGVIAFFHGQNLDIKVLTKGTGLKIIDERRFGESFLTILTA